MGNKLYVGNISFNSTEQDLRDLFSEIGEIESLKLITDKITGRSRGFGFVEMASEEDARKAIAAINGKELMGKTLTVSEARPQQPRTGGFQARRGGGGGFGGGRKGEKKGWR